MCGIAGLVEAPGSVVAEDLLVRMGDALAHRGPDDGRTWRGAGRVAHVGLSHRRLSILDHEGGKQPMLDAPRGDERIALVFNGQIYNHMELRQELIRLGARFVSDHSDTEVLVHGAR